VNKVDGAAAVEPDLGAFIARRARALDGVRCEPAQLAALPRLRRGRAAIRGSASLSGEIHVSAKFAAVIGEAQPGLERHCAGRMLLRRPQFGGVDPELIGREVDHPLDNESRLGTAVAAVGPDRIVWLKTA